MTDNFSVRRPRTIDERISEAMTKREIDFIQKLKPEFLSGRFFNGSIGSSQTDGTPSGGGDSGGGSTNPPQEASGGDDGGVCNTLNAGVCRAMKLNAAQGLKTNGIIISVSVRACSDGGHARIKILGDLVTCGVDPFSHPGGVIAETDSFPLLTGDNTVPLSATIPHDPYYSGASGCGANNPTAGAVWLAIEVENNKDLGYYGVSPFFGYTYERTHTYGTGSPSYNYPTDIHTDAYNVSLDWVETI